MADLYSISKNTADGLHAAADKVKELCDNSNSARGDAILFFRLVGVTIRGTGYVADAVAQLVKFD